MNIFVSDDNLISQLRDRQFTYKLILGDVRVTTAVAEKQRVSDTDSV
jgi:hypothetical protein